MIVKTAETSVELSGILQLQTQNLKGQISSTQAVKEGFVTVKHTLPLLKKMNACLGQVIAMDGDKVIGYALAMDRQLKADIPALVSLFRVVNKLTYKDQPLSEASFYVMGQVCIDAGYRGKGLFDQLYAQHKTLYASDFTYCLTSVSTSNLRSMKAHLRVGFEIVHSFSDALDEWNIILWDWN